jgi:membrane associated rhomboid family serine protease
MTDAADDLAETPPESAPPAEPMFNAPWPAVAVAAVIMACCAAQQLLPDGGLGLALFPQRVMAGNPAGLLTSLFLHGGWVHAGMNAAFALAFGAPVARLFGLRGRGVAAFFMFYLLCGVLAGLAFVVVHGNGVQPVVGASGAVAGLMGATARLMDPPGQLGSPFTRQSMSMAAAWIIVNLLMSATGLTPGANGAPIAWEAHLGGFAAGLLLVGPFNRLLTQKLRH